MCISLWSRGPDKGLAIAAVFKYRTNAPAVGCPIVKCSIREMKANLIKSFLTEQPFCPDPDECISALLEVFCANIVVAFGRQMEDGREEIWYLRR